ncbi:MAG: penicillin-binding protein 2 [Verrucomicrobia bacterium]|nr:penicillin-binding protein 2 [Verrucomicrobiota bacterium]
MKRVFHEIFRREEGRLTLLAVGIVIGLAMIGSTLFRIQVVETAAFGASQEKQSLRVVRVPALRGRIFDRNGVCLADNRPTFDAVLYFEELHGELRDLYRSEIRVRGKRLDAERRSQILSGLVHQKADAVGRLVGATPRLNDRAIRVHNVEQRPLPFVLVGDLSPQALAVAKEHHPLPVGVDIEVNAVRQYRYGPLAAHLLGYVTRERSVLETDLGLPTYIMSDMRGVSGLELKFDDELRGESGTRTILINAGGYKERELGYQRPKPGHDLKLSLDARCQHAVEAALGDHVGAAVLLDPRNGDVLAMVSSPSYDPNRFVPSIRPEDLAELQQNPDKPLANRACAEHYAPGSTFKLLVALAGLETGRIAPGSTSTCTGDTVVGGLLKRCWIKSKGGQHGPVNLREALKHSCNIFFYEHGVMVGMQAIVAMAQQFHLGEQSGIALPREARGHLPSPLKRGWRPADTANLAIGQGEVDTTVLQMACVVGTIANGGRVVAPRLVSSIHQAAEDGGLGSVVEDFPARDRGRLTVRPESLRIVRDGMCAVVNDADGTGKKAAVPGIKVAGKTGTAQVMDVHNNIIGHRAWFVSFAPFENPQYAMAILLEDGDSGGQTAAPIAGQIYAALFGVDTKTPKPASRALRAAAQTGPRRAL